MQNAKQTEELKKKVQGACGACILVPIFIVFLVSVFDKPVPEVPLFSSPIYSEIEVEKAMDSHFGEKTNMDQEKFIGASFEEESIGTVVYVDYRANDNLSERLIRGSLHSDAEDFFRDIAPLFEDDVDSVVLRSYMDFVDAYGEVSMGLVMTVEMYRETWERISWENFYNDNIPNVADTYISRY